MEIVRHDFLSAPGNYSKNQYEREKNVHLNFVKGLKKAFTYEKNRPKTVTFT